MPVCTSRPCATTNGAASWLIHASLQPGIASTTPQRFTGFVSFAARRNSDSLLARLANFSCYASIQRHRRAQSGYARARRLRKLKEEFTISSASKMHCLISPVTATEIPGPPATVHFWKHSDQSSKSVTPTQQHSQGDL